MDIKKVYVVTEGAYSDYGIHSIWSNKKEADDMAKILSHSEYNSTRVEEWEIDKPCLEKMGFTVRIDLESGELTIPEDKWDIKNPYLCVITKPGHGYYDFKQKIIYAEHFSVEQALKSARDFRIQELAKKSGV